MAFFFSSGSKEIGVSGWSMCVWKAGALVTVRLNSLADHPEKNRKIVFIMPVRVFSVCKCSLHYKVPFSLATDI